ncbi:Uncharacterised protein [Segatella copri]|nr:Uncharacterised protein [Segatella copri]
MSTMHSLPIAAHEAATVATVLIHAARRAANEAETENKAARVLPSRMVIPFLK